MKMKLKPVTRQPLRHQVLRRLLQGIAAQGLGPDDRLPTERELAADLQVSRNTVRDALKTLEVIGALIRSPKRGSVLGRVDFSLLAELSQAMLLRTADDFDELLVARRAFELSVIPVVIANATHEDFEQIEAANQICAATFAAGEAPTDGDLGFHQAILKATHNQFLIQFGTLLQEFFRAVQPRVVPSESGFRRTLKEHTGILEALYARDTERALKLMGLHLDSWQPYRAPLSIYAPKESKTGQQPQKGHKENQL